MRYKKIFIGGLYFAIGVSCSIHETDIQETGDNSVFYASIEHPSEDEGTRVFVNQDFRVLWDEGDKVAIFNKKNVQDEYRFSGKMGDSGGTFELATDYVNEGAEIDHRYAIYPFSRSTFMEDTSIYPEGVFSVTLPTQHYREQSFGLCDNLMVAVTDGNEFQFMNACGYLMIKLFGKGVSVSSITLKGNNGEKISGMATVTMPFGGSPMVEMMASDSSTRISLTCETPIRLGATEDESTPFWFVIPPITFSKGFTIIVYCTDGIFFKTTDKPQIIERNKVSKMTPIETYLPSSVPVPEAIDLGLSVKWASFNLGASGLGEFGDYYAWGEIESKQLYNWPSYKFCVSGDDWYNVSFSKYNTESAHGVVDNNTVLDTGANGDDVVSLTLGGKWRMPTNEEWIELLENCSWTWTIENGIEGVQFISNVAGYTDNWIFLPAAGYKEYSKFIAEGTYGLYWSSSLNTDKPYNAWDLLIRDSGLSYTVCRDFDFRYRGHSIRPVCAE